MLTPAKHRGNLGEELAAHFLRSKGYEIIDYHVRSRFGEIDLVAEDGETLVFVEVKTRTNQEFGTPEEALTSWKQYKLVHAAEDYLSRVDRMREDWRIDLVAIEMESNGKMKRITHYQNALW